MKFSEINKGMIGGFYAESVYLQSQNPIEDATEKYNAFYNSDVTESQVRKKVRIIGLDNRRAFKDNNGEKYLSKANFYLTYLEAHGNQSRMKKLLQLNSKKLESIFKREGVRPLTGKMISPKNHKKVTFPSRYNSRPTRRPWTGSKTGNGHN